MAMKLPEQQQQQFNNAAGPKQQDICKGCLLNAAGNTIPPHFADRRDKYCHQCVWRKGLGVRNVERARIRVVPSSIMQVGKQTCQVGIYDITAVPNTGSEQAPRSLQVRKRHKVSYLGGTACAQKLDFLDARGTVLDIVPGNSIIAVEVQEVGGMTHQSGHSVGLARVPAKHCGRGASLVVVFATSEEAQFFDAVFQRAFGVPVATLISGDELFVFDAKRAAFAPFCSITQRLANYNVPPCELCAKTHLKKKKRSFVDIQLVLQTTTQFGEEPLDTGKDEVTPLVESMSTHDESTESPKSAATPESSPPVPDAPPTPDHWEDDTVKHPFAEPCGCCHDEHACKKCKNDSQDAESFDPGAFFCDTSCDEGMVDLPEVCDFDCTSFDSAGFGQLATPPAVVSDVSKASDDESNGNANEHCTTVVGDVELPEHQPIQLPSDLSASFEWMDTQTFAPTMDDISRGLNARAA